MDTGKVAFEFYHIVDKKEIENAVYIQQLTTQVLQILSPAIAGMLVSMLSYRNIYLTDIVVIIIVLCLLSGFSYESDSQNVQKKEEKLEIQIESNSSAWYNML